MAFVNVNGKLQDKTSSYFDKSYTGWWNSLTTADLNADGKQDLVLGNVGLNTQCRASEQEPAELFYKDFDNNGAIDPILCFYIQHKSYPYVTRDELLDQMSSMRGKFTDYKSYADASMNEIFTEEERKDMKSLKATHLATSYFERGADKKFHLKTLPLQAQFSPVFTITPVDYDKNGSMDLLLCGNINRAKLRFGKADANYGVLLKNDGKGNFTYIDQAHSGFQLRGDVRSVLQVNNMLLFGINQQPVKAYKAEIVMMKFFPLVFITLMVACSRPSQEVAVNSAQLSKVIEKMTDIMVHDVTNPPLAARFFSYATLAGYEIVSKHNKQLKSMHGRLNQYPEIKIPDSISGYSYQLSAVLAMMETASKLQPSGHMMREYEKQFIDSCIAAGSK